MTESESERVDVYFGDETDDSDSLSHGHIGSMHIKLGDIGALRNSLIAGLLADLATHSLPVAVGTSTAAALVERFKKLNIRELFVFDALRALSNGGSLYRVWIEEGRLLDKLKSESAGALQMSEESARRELASMKSRGILEEGAGQWRAVW